MSSWTPTNYKTNNGPHYNRALKQRGSLSIWFDAEMGDQVRLELREHHCELALINLAIDSKQLGCDLVKMKVIDVMASGQMKERALVLQSKTQKPVRLEISEGMPPG